MKVINDERDQEQVMKGFKDGYWHTYNLESDNTDYLFGVLVGQKGRRFGVNNNVYLRLKRLVRASLSVVPVDGWKELDSDAENKIREAINKAGIE